MWPKLLHSQKSWAEVSTSALCLLPRDCQLTPLCFEMLSVIFKEATLDGPKSSTSSPLGLLWSKKTGKLDLPLWDHWQLHFHLPHYAQWPRWDSQRYGWLYSMKYFPGHCKFCFLQLYPVMSFRIFFGIAAVFSNIQYTQLLQDVWSLFRTR